MGVKCRCTSYSWQCRMPAGVSWTTYLKFAMAAGLSMVAGAQTVHHLYRWGPGDSNGTINTLLVVSIQLSWVIAT